MSFGPTPASRHRIATLLALACVLLLPSPAGSAEQIREPIDVLILSFGNRDWPPLSAMVEEFRAELEQRETAPVYIYVESLDAYAPSNEIDFYQAMEEFLASKYRNRSIDVVVAVGARPMDFLLPRHDRLFPGAKVLYTTSYHKPIPGATGVVIDLNVLPTVEMALRQNPGTRRLLLISGDSPADRMGIAQLRDVLRGQLKRAGPSVEVETLKPMSYTEARQYLAELPRDTVGLFVFYFGDSAGQVVNPGRVLPEFSGLCPRPIYALWDTDVGRGSVGGQVISLGQVGRALAELADRVLRGENPDHIPPAQGSFQYDVFDWQQMKRWGMRLDQLPPGSTVLNREYTAWELYRWQIVGGVTLILVEFSLIGLLLYVRTKRRRALEELAHSHRLESVVAELSAAFLNLPADVVNAEVDSALEHLLQALELDRISVFEFTAEERLRMVFAKRAAGLPAPPGEAAPEATAWLAPRLRNGQKIVATRLEDLPSEAEDLRRVADGFGIRSLAILPLHCDGVTFGALTCATVHRYIFWSRETLDYLQAVADIFGSALKRKRAEEALLQSEQLKASILSSLNSQIAVVDRSGRIIASNEQWRAFTRKFEGDPAWVREEDGHFKPCRACGSAHGPGDTVQDAVRQVWEGRRESFEVEYECVVPDGLGRWFLMTVTPLQGGIGGAVISHHDITESKKSEQAIRELSGKLITAQEEERSRIARELHDDINQQLALLAIDLQLLDKSQPSGPSHSQLEKLWQKTNEISADIQGLSHQLHSAKLEHLGLISALRELCQDFRKEQLAAIEFSATDVPSTLDIETSLTLFRIAQECLRNAGKHSQARKVRVELEGGGGFLTLRISDDGVGFTPGQPARRSGLGMVSMQERLRLVGGELVVRSAEAAGTMVEARVPVPAKDGTGRPSIGGKGGDEEPARQGGAHRLDQVRSHS